MTSGGEFDLIARLFAPLATGFPGALGLGDDAAILEPPAGTRLVATMDAVVGGVHFLPGDPPDLIARKLMRVNLSDLAAMGAKPWAVMLAAAFAADADDAWLSAFAAGLAADCHTFGVALIGGDTVATPGPPTFAMTALGLAEGPVLRRDGARPGDTVLVSGSIGDAALGLAVLKGRLSLAPEHAAALSDRYRLPQPRLGLGGALTGLAHAGIDVSDGLVQDLGHICERSGVAMRIEAAAVPVSPAARAALDTHPELLAGAVLGGGDDYELAFTAPPEAVAAIVERAAAVGVPVTTIGRVDVGSGVAVLGPDGRALPPLVAGYQHFRRGG